MTMGKVTFSTKNLLKDNPRNIERVAAGARRIVAIVAGLSIIQGSDMLALWVVIGGAFLDEVKNFFGTIATEQEQISVKFPAHMADQVEVSEGPVKNEDNENKLK